MSSRPPRTAADLTRLVGSQTIYYGAVSVDLTLTSLAGLRLAPTPLLATLPLTLITGFGLLASVAAGLLTARYGYRAVMAMGGGCAVAGGLLAMTAVYAHAFWLLCVATSLLGAYRSTGGYIRYLAADLAPDGRKERSLSIVMYGGLIAAFLGPFAALAASRAFPVEFAGSYALVAVLGLAAVPLALTVSREPRPVPPPAGAGGGGGAQAPATFTESRGNPNFVAALVLLPLSGALMTLVMAIGPLANAHAHHSSATGAALIQWHLVGMFAPALISGELMRRIGPWHTALTGIGITLLGGFAGASGDSAAAMMGAMVCAGVGWNFTYLAGTAFLVRSYATGRGSRLQAAVEGATGAVSVVASLLSATAFDTLGWRMSGVLVLAVAGPLLMWQFRYGRRNATAADALDLSAVSARAVVGEA
ncbi:MFS transporter [Streptomyces sp. NBC_01497]|uniref:MFS transporter n=1 Tax=Streptomyces sp. NBC_01497 TaxID=2903885 RepID=UPI002E34BDA2|nr:MFS transporter [Streptomyces sp. NBC_01497]